MDTENHNTENDGAAQALSVLYEANDLLNALRTVSGESADPMGSTEWTLTGEVSERLNRAIAHLDVPVPKPEIHNAAGAEKPADKPAGSEAERSQTDVQSRIFQISCDLDSLAVTTQLVRDELENHCGNAVVPLDLIVRECERIGSALIDLGGLPGIPGAWVPPDAAAVLATTSAAIQGGDV